MIKSSMRQALRESLMGMKKGLRNKRAKSHVKDEDELEPGETNPDEEDAEHEAEEPKKERIAEGENEGWRDEQKNFMKNKSKPNKTKTAIIIAVPGPAKKFGKANFGKKG